MDTSGFSEVLTALERRQFGERITLFQFDASDRIFTVFVTTANEILGCIRVVKKL